MYAQPSPILPVCGVQKFMPQGTQIDGYVLPFDSEGLESVPIRGFTHSTGSVILLTVWLCRLAAAANRRKISDSFFIIITFIGCPALQLAEHVHLQSILQTTSKHNGFEAERSEISASILQESSRLPDKPVYLPKTFSLSNYFVVMSILPPFLNNSCGTK